MLGKLPLSREIIGETKVTVSEAEQGKGCSNGALREEIEKYIKGWDEEAGPGTNGGGPQR